MRRILALILTVLAATIGLASPAEAGSPHFIQSAFDLDVSGNTVTVSGKEAGLGDEEQIHVVLSFDAECINRGSNKPQAANKESFTAEGDFPVQNGKADFTLTATATFQPSCSPPMSVRISNVTVTDETNGLVKRF